MRGHTLNHIIPDAFTSKTCRSIGLWYFRRVSIGTEPLVFSRNHSITTSLIDVITPHDHTTTRPTCQTTTMTYVSGIEFVSLFFSGVLEFSRKSDILPRSILLFMELYCIKQCYFLRYVISCYLPTKKPFFFCLLWEVNKGNFAKKKR